MPKSQSLPRFDTTEHPERYRCAGACGLLLPVNKFPTIKGTTDRYAECRKCRDARTPHETREG